jgi:hypothetical protein
MAEDFHVGDKVRVANRVDGVIVLLARDQTSAIVDIPCDAGRAVMSALLSQLTRIESRETALANAASA